MLTFKRSSASPLLLSKTGYVSSRYMYNTSSKTHHGQLLVIKDLSAL